MLGYFLHDGCCKGRTKKDPLQKVDFLHIELELWHLNYQTPIHADSILKYQENRPKICFLVDNFFNFEVISKINISKQIYKGK
jgi:Mg2+/Co2+ transporter CorB